MTAGAPGPSSRRVRCKHGTRAPVRLSPRVLTDTKSAHPNALAQLGHDRIDSPSQVRTLTVPKSGWGRISHQISRTGSIASALPRVIINHWNSPQFHRRQSKPAVGKLSKILTRHDASRSLLPERGGAGRECEQVRDKRDQQVKNRDCLFGALNAHVYMQPKDHQPAGRPLTPVYGQVIPTFDRNLLFGPACEWVRSGHGELVSHLVTQREQRT